MAGYILPMVTGEDIPYYTDVYIPPLTSTIDAVMRIHLMYITTADETIPPFPSPFPYVKTVDIPVSKQLPTTAIHRASTEYIK